MAKVGIVRRIPSVVLLCAAGAILASCGSSGTTAPAPKPKPKPTTTTSAPTPTTTSPTSVTIAVEGPMSGPQGATGQDILRGAQLAVANLNAGGGVLGRQLLLLPADDAADPAKGVAVAQQMLGQHVAGVVGPFNSSVGVKNLPLYRDAGVPLARLTSATSTEGFGVTTQPMESQIAPVEAQELTGVLHARSVAILFDPSTYTSAIASQLRGLLGHAAVAVPIFRAVEPGGSAAAFQQATKTALQAVAAARPSVTYLAMYGPEAGKVVAAMNGGAPYGRCFVDLAAQGPDFTAAAGSSAAGCLASGVPPAGQLPSTSAAGYVSQYQAKFHAAPGTWGPFAYDSVQLLAQAATRAGTWSSPAVSQRLASIAGYQGVTGPITIEAKTGNRANPPVVILGIASTGAYGVDPTWAAFAAYKGPTTPTTAPPTTAPTTTTAPPTTTTTRPTTTTTTRPTTTTTTTGPTTTTRPTTTTTAPATTTTGHIVPTTSTTTTPNQKWKGRTISVGAIFSTSGTGQPYGQSQAEGAGLALAQIQAAGGINGASLQLSVVNDESDPATATSQMTAFASSGALAVLGPTFTNSALMADPVANSLGLPVLAVSNTGPGIVGDCASPCPWSFRDSLGEATAIPANVTTYVTRSRPASAVVVAPQNDTFGRQTGQIATNAFVSAGVRAGAPVLVPVTEPALKQALTAALASHPSALMVTASSATLAGTIIDDARSTGFRGAILGGNAFNSPVAAKTAGTAGRGAQSGAAWYSGNTSPINTSFVTAFTQRYHRAPDQFAAQAYTGVKLLAAALQGAPLGFTSVAADRSALRAALARVRLDTPLGPFAFTAQHDVVQPVWVVAMNGKGGYTLVKKVPPSAAKSPTDGTTTTARH